MIKNKKYYMSSSLQNDGWHECNADNYISSEHMFILIYDNCTKNQYKIGTTTDPYNAKELYKKRSPGINLIYKVVKNMKGIEKQVLDILTMYRLKKRSTSSILSSDVILDINLLKSIIDWCAINSFDNNVSTYTHSAVCYDKSTPSIWTDLCIYLIDLFTIPTPVPMLICNDKDNEHYAWEFSKGNLSSIISLYEKRVN